MNKVKRLLHNTFFLSLILHLFLFLSLTIIISFKPKEPQKPPHLYIPSYIYQEAISSPNLSKHTVRIKKISAKNNASLEKSSRVKKIITFKEKSIHLNKPMQINTNKISKLTKKFKSQKNSPSMLETSFAELKTQQMHSLQRRQETKPILLIGDLNQVADPIIRLMAQSLSAHFSYPEAEGMLGIKGRVVIELVLHPEGNFTQIHLLKSSHNQNLDSAALYAANTAPRVIGANRFLSSPTRFIVGFVFN